MAPRALPGIFCLEGQWGKRLDDRASVLPTLELLERIEIATFIHRDFGTREELSHYIAKWGQLGYQKYGVLYLAAHGVKGAIQVGRGAITLDELADVIDGTARGRTVYFGSCDVMRDKSGVANFRRVTGAKLVCGYTKTVDWLDSAAFDLMLLRSLVSNNRVDKRVNDVLRDYPDLSRRLGFHSERAPVRGSGTS